MDKDVSQDHRLDRIEQKIDRISDALVTLARVEEKIAMLEERRIEHSETLAITITKVESMDNKLTRIHERLDMINKIVWASIIGMLGILGQQISQVL